MPIKSRVALRLIARGVKPVGMRAVMATVSGAIVDNNF